MTATLHTNENDKPDPGTSNPGDAELGTERHDLRQVTQQDYQKTRDGEGGSSTGGPDTLANPNDKRPGSK